MPRALRRPGNFSQPASVTDVTLGSGCSSKWRASRVKAPPIVARRARRYRGAMPNFVLLDTSRPDIAHLLVAMLQAREAVDPRSWSHPQELTGEDWWADVLADPRARKRKRRDQLAVKQAVYRLSDEQQATILVECSKCDWKAAYGRNELIASHGAEYPLPSLLNELAKPGCTRLSNQWDHCGAHYVEAIDRLK